MKSFRLPDLGEGLQEAEIVSWHVSEGDRIVVDQPLLSVETAKAVVEVPSPWSGTVVKLHGEPGDIIAIGEPIADFDTDGKTNDAGTVVGDLPVAIEKGERSPTEEASERAGAVKPKAAPAVRKFARERGVDLDHVTGTGPGAVITRADVAAAQARPDKDDYEPLRGVRRAMASNMAKARSEIAPATVTDEALITHWPKSEDITLRLVRSVVAGCRAEPALNAWFDAEKMARKLHPRVDVGMAMDTGDGLFVPVIRDAGNRTPADLRAGLDTMRKDVLARAVKPEELRGQTITLSNFGTLGGHHASLVVSPPQVAILGAGRVAMRARIINGQIAPSKVLPLSVTFDHRAVTGGEAARFLAAVIADLEQ